MIRYSVGIDLGTTHSALSYWDLGGEAGDTDRHQVLSIPQLTELGAIEERPLLPSFLYFPPQEELRSGGLGLPWDPGNEEVVGELARRRGAQIPSRLVASAKSWLCHSGVDRRAAILPWEAPEEVERISPLGASARYLKHLSRAWEYRNGSGSGANGAALTDQQIVLTVPASFDEVARELTREAADWAGLTEAILLEEPQAALYAWLEKVGDDFREQVSVGDLILVVDVGGGTTDFSLIAVAEREGELELIRVAVGDHILLGGDNMDLTLAHVLRQRLSEAGKTLDRWQFDALTYGCRQAKENLLNRPELEKTSIPIPSRGTALVGGTIQTELHRADVESVLIDGFFPQVEVTEQPRTARRTGLAELGLPYAQDPGVTRHLAWFLTRQARSIQTAAHLPVSVEAKTFVHPTAILFNGGVFKSSLLRERVVSVLNQWLEADGGGPVSELAGADLDLSVARGAAYYGRVRQGHGIRIRGGTARAYYVGVESAAPAVPGFEPPVKALCVAPFGMEEGTEAEIPPEEFGLVVGEPTRFRFFASSVRREDQVGDILDHAPGHEDLEELPPIETTLSVEGTGSDEGRLIPIRLQAAVTELGLLELRCLEKGGTHRWKLEFNVRMKD